MINIKFLKKVQISTRLLLLSFGFIFLISSIAGWSIAYDLGIRDTIRLNQSKLDRLENDLGKIKDFPCVIDERAIDKNKRKQFEKELSFAIKFEKLRYEQKAEELLNVFEPPQNDDEKATYDFITFREVARPPYLRLFVVNSLSSKTEYCLINGTEKMSDKAVINISEARRQFNPAGGKDISYFDKYTLELKSKDSSFLVRQYYYSKGHSDKSRKYEGLFTIVCNNTAGLFGLFEDTSCLK
jgi:hypothetical protein